MNPEGGREEKALHDVKSYLEQTGRKAPESFLTRSKKTYEVLAKLVVSKVQAPAKPNAHNYIRSAAAAPVQQQVCVEPTSPVRNLVFFLCGIVGLASVIGIALAVQRYSESQSDFQAAVQAMHSNSPQLALKELDQAYQLGYRNAQLHLLRGCALAAMGDYGKAVDDFNAVVIEDARNADALTARADCDLHLFNYEKAIADCTAALKLKPNLPGVLAMRAVAFAQCGKEAASLADCEQFLKISKDESANLDIKATRALANWKSGKQQDAIKDLDAIIAARQTMQGLHLLRAQCLLDLAKTSDAVDDLTAELKLAPGNLTAINLRAKSLLKLNRRKEALGDLDVLLEKNPAVDLYLARAGVYMALKEYEPAVDDYDRAMQMKPAAAELKAKREEAWQLLKKYRPMVATIKETIRDAAAGGSTVPKLQEGADALTAKGYAQYRQGKLDDAIDTLSAAVRANPAAPAPRRYLAYACMAVGNCVDASSQFQALMGMNQLDENDQMQYARALTALGRADEAIEILKDVVATNPGNSWARMSLIKLYLDAGATTKAMRLSKDGLNSASTESERAAYSNLLRATMSGAH